MISLKELTVYFPQQYAEQLIVSFIIFTQLQCCEKNIKKNVLDVRASFLLLL